MNRGSKICSVLAFTLAIVAVVPTTADERKPNVIFILADDLGYRELGCFGQTLIQTPNIDRLATEGMRFTQHYCGNAVCAPSRCVLMTGKHPGHAYIRNNKATPPEGQQPIPSSEVTLAEVMKGQGYITGTFGKWGLGGPGSAGEPLQQGVDRFFGYNCQSHAHSYYPSYLWSNTTRIQLNNDPPVPGHASLAKDADPSDPRSYDPFKGSDYAPDRINEQALEFIRQNRDRPFFLYYPTVIPHVALHVPDEELKPYLAKGWNDPPFTRPKGGYTPHFTPRAAYAAMITRMDRYVGNVLKLLEELKIADNTIVVFSSDNGTTHLGQEVDYKFFNSVGELRGLKGSLYEGGVRVPTIVRWPGNIAAGSSSERVSGFEDWMPTMLDLVGGQRKALPRSVDGISMAPTLLGRRQAARPFLYREFGGYGGQQSVRVGDWKAIRQNIRRGKLKTELYNLANDINEQNDISADHPELLAKLETLMAREHMPSKVFPMPALDRESAETN